MARARRPRAVSKQASSVGCVVQRRFDGRSPVGAGRGVRAPDTRFFRNAYKGGMMSGGVCSDVASSVARDRLQDRNPVVYEWTTGDADAMATGELLSTANGVFQHFKSRVDKGMSLRDARRDCSSSTNGSRLYGEYPRIFNMVTDAETLRVPARLAGLVELGRLRDALDRRKMDERECRKRVVELAKRDMELRAAS